MQKEYVDMVMEQIGKGEMLRDMKDSDLTTEQIVLKNKAVKDLDYLKMVFDKFKASSGF